MDAIYKTEAARSGVAAAPVGVTQMPPALLGVEDVLFTALVEAAKAEGFLPLITDKTKVQGALLGSMAQEHLLAQTEPRAVLGLLEMPTL